MGQLQPGAIARFNADPSLGYQLEIVSSVVFYDCARVANFGGI